VDDLDVQLFDLVTIANATNNFSTVNIIGQGGFGSVYKVNQFLIITTMKENKTVINIITKCLYS